ncbi:MAG: DUF1570 domain-containing protein [Planctomycetota bacterium]|jgi:hypothetical protein
MPQTRCTQSRPIGALRLAGAVLLALASAGRASSGFPPPEEREERMLAFFEQYAELRPGEVEAALCLADEANELELWQHADLLYREVLLQDRRNEPAHRALWHLADGRPLEAISEAYARTRELLPEDFRELETRRYVVFSDADPKWTREQAERLERAYDRFIHFAHRLDLRPLPLRHKLVAVVFSDIEDFRPFARQDGLIMEAAAGYYSPPADRLVFFHVESLENVARIRESLQTQYDELEAARRAARRQSSLGYRDEGRAMRRAVDQQLEQATSRESQLNDFARRQSIVVTVHEAIHQLMFHTYVQSPHVEHPAWLSEGLATTFETDNPKAAFGPLREFSRRRDGFTRLLEQDRLLPLRRLVTIDHATLQSNPAVADVLYDQSYAFVTWLCRNRKLQLQDFIHRLNELPAGNVTGEKHLEVFEAAFGDVDRLERIWLRVERNR